MKRTSITRYVFIQVDTSCMRITEYFQSKWVWTNNSPAAYMPFGNYQFNTSDTSCDCFDFNPPFPCNTILTSEPNTHAAPQYSMAYCSLIDKYTNISSVVLYPSTSDKYKCTLVKVLNLAEPDWININCNHLMLPNVLCVQHKQLANISDDVNVNLIGKEFVCPTQTISISRTCCSFIWTKTTAKDTTKHFGEKGMNEFSLSELKQVKDIFKSINANFPPLVTAANSETIVTIICRKLFVLHSCIYHKEFWREATGFQVFKSDLKQNDPRKNLLSCKEGGNLMVSLRCDGTIDCPNDKSDEENCICSEDVTATELGKCKHISSQKGSQCSPLYFTTHDNKCLLYSSTIFTTNNYISQCSQEDMQNDLVVDWDFNWKESNNWGLSEEGDLITLLQGKIHFCHQPMELPCLDGHSKCFHISQICLFSLDSCGHTFPCRNGGHMEDCKSFDCNKHFKCERSYCIPWTYVCDNKWDCPQGEDELFQHVCGASKFVCLGMFRCWRAQSCILIASVCDEIKDCPSGDDEQFCQLKDIQCPKECACLAFAIMCHKDHAELWVYPFWTIKVTHSPLVIQYVHKFTMCIFLLIQNSNNSEKHINFPPALLCLDLQGNALRIIPPGSFSHNTKLKCINLSWNQIRVLFSKSFSGLSNLVAIVLSGNPLAKLPPKMLYDSKCLLYISVVNITFLESGKDVFAVSEPNVIHTMSYQLCCIKASSSICMAKIPWFKSCKNLLENHKIETSFVVVFTGIILANFVSSIVHVVSMTKSNKAFTAIVLTKNVSNLFLAVYLGILWVSDTITSDTFMAKDMWWRSGPTCFAAYAFSFLFIMSSKTDTLLLSLS